MQDAAATFADSGFHAQPDYIYTIQEEPEAAVPADGTQRDAGEQDEVSVLVRYRGYSVSKGAFIKLRSGRDDRKAVCAVMVFGRHISGESARL